MIKLKHILSVFLLIATCSQSFSQVKFDLYSGVYSRFERKDYSYLINALNGYQFGFHLNYAFPNSRFEIGLGAATLFSTAKEDFETYDWDSNSQTSFVSFQERITKGYELFPEAVLNYCLLNSQNSKWKLDIHIGLDLGSFSVHNYVEKDIASNEIKKTYKGLLLFSFFEVSSKFGFVNRYIFDNNNELRLYLNLRRTYIAPHYSAFQAGLAFRFAKSDAKTQEKQMKKSIN